MISVRSHFLILFYLFIGLHAYSQSGKALVLDGRNNYLAIDDHPDFDQNQAISIEAWINPNCTDNAMIISKQWCSGQYSFYLYVRNGKLRWNFSNDGFCNVTNSYETNNIVIQPYQFTHVAVVHSQSSIKLFINGSEEPSSYINGGTFATISNSTEPFRIGAYRNQGGLIRLHYSGLIDELRFWKTELTQTQISQRMNSTLTGNETDLVVYLDMEENGVGSNLQLVNKAASGSTFNPHTREASTNTPYCALPIDYTKNNFELIDSLVSCVESGVTIDIDPTYYTSIEWSDGTTSPSNTFSQSGTYWVAVETERCLFYRDTIVYEQLDATSIQETLSICEGDTLFINNLVIVDEGIYRDTIDIPGQCDTIYVYTIETLEATDSNLVVLACNQDTAKFMGITLTKGMDTTIIISNYSGCDSILNISVRGSTSIPFLGGDVISCDAVYRLDAPASNTTWSTGETGTTIDVIESGTYSARYVDENGCIIYDTISIALVNSNIFVPNAFTPNQDLTNDCFRPIFSAELTIKNYTFKIFNRWGQLVFSSDTGGQCWDGTYMNKPAQIGAYMWYLKGYNNECGAYVDLKGTVTLVR